MATDRSYFLSAKRIAAAFVLFGTVWILGSDRAIQLVTRDVDQLALIQSFKGLIFVSLSGALIYGLTRMAEREQQRLKQEVTQQHAHLSQILDMVPVVIYALRPVAGSTANQPQGWALDFISHTVQHVSGYAPDVWAGTSDFLLPRIHPDDRERFVAGQKLLMSQGWLRHEYRFLHADGQYRWIDDTLILHRDDQGQAAALVGVWLDITLQRQADQHARLIEKVFNASQEGIFITDAKTRFITANQAFTDFTGYGLEEIQGKTPALLRSGRQDKSFYDAMWACIHATGRWEGEIWNKKKSGELFPEWLTISAIRNAQGQVEQYLGLFTDTSSHKAAEARIEQLVHYDALTSLPNRTLLADRAQMACSMAQQQGSTLMVMHLNLDRFGLINETLGHAVGDLVLAEVARRLGDVIEPDHTLSRLGGDDFVLLLPGMSTAEVAPFSLRLMQAIDAPLLVASQALRLSACIGVAVHPDNGSTWAELNRAAETAVHHAKREGRSTVRFFSNELQGRVLEAISLTTDLRQALERQELCLYYQPQWDAQALHIVGAEALIRWQHPQRGMVSPGIFIPLAEEAGLIRDIGAWVIQEAVRQNAAWQAAGLLSIPVAVNLSAVQFRDPKLKDLLQSTLQQHRLAPDLLELELTESVAIENSDFTVKTIAELKQLGLRLSIDDFGTGYSSLSYLKRFAVDKLKIDQSFVRGLQQDAKDEAIVATIISLARNLNLRTVAEGVETRVQADWLQTAGCDELQGYLLGRPVSAEAMTAVLREACVRHDPLGSIQSAPC